MRRATLFVTVALSDAAHWEELHVAANKLGAMAAVLHGDALALCPALDQLVAAGHREIAVVGVTLAEGNQPHTWVKRVARWWLANHLEVRVTMPPATWYGLPTRLPQADQLIQLTPKADGLTNPHWQNPPPMRKHLLICRGARCSAKGADAVAAALQHELRERGLFDNGVLVTQTGCLYPCNRAPMVAWQPDMAFVGPVLPEEAAGLCDRFLAGIEPEKDVDIDH